MARHRIHSLAFKKQIVEEYAAGATLDGLARQHDLSRNLIRIWIAKSKGGEFDPVGPDQAPGGRRRITRRRAPLARASVPSDGLARVGLSPKGATGSNDTPL